jgi:allantoinase
LQDGRIDLIASNHSRATAELKLAHQGYSAMPCGGIAGLQVSLPSV